MGDESEWIDPHRPNRMCGSISGWFPKSPHRSVWSIFGTGRRVPAAHKPPDHRRPGSPARSHDRSANTPAPCSCLPPARRCRVPVRGCLPRGQTGPCPWTRRPYQAALSSRHASLRIYFFWHGWGNSLEISGKEELTVRGHQGDHACPGFYNLVRTYLIMIFPWVFIPGKCVFMV